MGVTTKTVKVGEVTSTIPKIRKQFDDVDRKKIEKNFKDKKLIVCGIHLDEYNRITTC